MFLLHFRWARCKLIKLLDLFQPIKFSLSKFDSLDPLYQTSKARIRYVGKDLAVFSAFIFPVEEKAFVLAHFTRQDISFSTTKKTLKINASNSFFFWKWVKLLLYNFGLFQQVFENLKLNKSVKEERRLDSKDRIWRLKFGKTQFWSYILKNEFESLYFWKASFHFFGVW